jgi:hypothetical protein
MSQLGFRSYLAHILIKTESGTHSAHEDVSENADINKETPKSTYGRPSKNALPNELRYDNAGHVVTQEVNKARRRRRQCRSTTMKNVNYICSICVFFKITNPKVAFTQQFAMPFLFVLHK